MSNLVEQDRRITVYEVANEVGFSHGTAFAILTQNIVLSKLSARWVPKALREGHLNQRADLSLSMLSKIEANEDDLALYH